MYSKLNEEQNLTKVVKSIYIFLTTPDEVKKYVEMMRSSSSDNCICHFIIKTFNLFDQELQLINNKPIIEYKLKELLSELKKFNVQSILVLEYKKRNYKIFHSSTILIANDSDIDEAFKPMHQTIMMRIKSSASEDWVVETIVKHYIEIFGY